MKKAINTILGAIFGFAAGLAIFGIISVILSSTIDESLSGWPVVIIRLVPIILGILLGLFRSWWKTLLIMLVLIVVSVLAFFIIFIICAIIGLFLNASGPELMAVAVIIGMLAPSGIVVFIIGN